MKNPFLQRFVQIVFIYFLVDVANVWGQTTGHCESWPGEYQVKAEINEHIRLNSLPQNAFDEYLLFRRNEALQLYNQSPNIKPAIIENLFKKNEEVLYDTTLYPLGSCNNLDFETGNFNGWTALSGCNPANNSILTCTPKQSCCPTTGIKPARHTLTTLAMGNDPVCGFPKVAPGGSFSAMIGQPSGGGQADRLQQTFLVTKQNSAFIYQYAVVLQDPGHSNGKNPKFEAAFFDQTGDTIPCSYYLIEANHYIPGGFYVVPYDSLNSYTMYGSVMYRPWTYVVVDLSSYIGQNVTARFTAMDCGEGLHYGYAYIDCACGPWEIQPSDSVFCEGDSINVTLTAPSGANYYTWNTGDTTQTISVHSTGTYSVEVGMVVDSTCKSILTFDLNGFPKPDPGFTATTVCLGNPTVFTDTSSIDTGFVASQTWNFGDGSPPSSQQNPTHTYTAAGTYTVTLTLVSDRGCSDTISKTVVVAPPVTPAFSANMVCLGDPTIFNDNTTGAISSYSWNFGDGDTSSIQSPSHVFATAGTHSVTLTVTSASGCSQSVTVTVFVNSANADFTTTTVCLNNQTLFSDLSSTIQGSLSAWSWDFGDGSTSTLQNPSHTYNATGTYTTTLVVTNNSGCKDTFLLSTLVNPLPVVNFLSSPVCLGDSTCFTDLSSVTPGTLTGWSWNFGDPSTGSNNISNSSAPCHLFSLAGTFSVMLTVTSNNNCQNNLTLPIIIYPSPNAFFSSNAPCLGSITSLSDGSTAIPGDPITNWNWAMQGGNPATATGQNAYTTYSATGSYSVSLIVTTQAGCKDTIDQPVIVHSPPLANFTGGGAGCGPLCNNYNDFSISSDSTISSWVWSFPGGIPASSNLQNPNNICYETAGTYGASLIITSYYGCKDTIKKPALVTVYPWPKADFCVAPDKAPSTDPVFTFCPQWSPNPGVTNWMWDFGDGSATDSISTNPVHSYSAVATSNDFYSYNVCLKVQNLHGCWDTTCHTVELTPEFDFYIPNAFTPNGDQINEMFFGKCRGVKEYNIWLFDRWGNMIWDCHKTGENTDFDSSGQDGLSSFCYWDGIVQSGGADMNGRSGQLAQEDVYVWKVKLLDIFNRTHDYVGQVSVVK